MRQPRFENEPGIWHVTARGVEKRSIFVDVDDRSRYLAQLGEIATQLSWRIYQYTLMTNHVHHVIETVEPNLGVGIGKLHGDYAQRFNWRHGRWGHLFGERFDSERILDEKHLLNACRYVALNPVRAGMVTNCEDYRWGSHPAIAGLEPPPAWLDVQHLLRLFDPDDMAAARQKYRDFVAEEAELQRLRAEFEIHLARRARLSR